MEASFSLCLNYGSMAREIDRSEPEIASDASGGTFERIRMERSTSADVLMTRRNVASYDCRSDVSAGLPGIAYVTHPRTVLIPRAYAEETCLR